MIASIDCNQSADMFLSFQGFCVGEDVGVCRFSGYYKFVLSMNTSATLPDFVHMSSHTSTNSRGGRPADEDKIQSRVMRAIKNDPRNARSILKVLDEIDPDEPVTSLLE